MSGLLQLVERRDRTVEEAQGGLDTIERLEAEQRERLDAARTEHARLNADSGRVALDAAISGDPTHVSDLSGRLVMARTAEDLAERGLETALAAKPRAVANLHRAQAKEWRAEAALLRAQAAQRQKKTDKLLADLQAWEEVEYVASRSGRRMAGIGPAGPVPLAASDGWNDPITGAKVSGPLNPFFDVVEIELPRTLLMIDDAEDLETRATAAEREAARLDPGP